MQLLHYREYGDSGGGGIPLLFLHGLFGSASNWGRVVTHFSAQHRCIAPDLRNHGRSFHTGEVGYRDQAEDLIRLMDHLAIESASLIGHSMGGKVAMQLALEYPQRCRKLVVVDIAPVRYRHGFGDIIESLRSIDLGLLGSRHEADVLLAKHLADPGLRGFLLQNLVRHDGNWEWRLNLEALAAGQEKIVGFPPQHGRHFAGETLFVAGEQSGYINFQDHATIHAFFPGATIVTITGAGHWVYAQQPAAFIEQLELFL
jgi:esterase